jgi:23S rRNA (cytosine1962-C5)-methyltransferase
MARVRLKSGHVLPVWSGHPWVYAQAIERVDGAPAAGDVVSVVDARDQVLGRGYWSPGSAIPVRILSRDPEEALDGAFLARRLDEAARVRREWLGLPGPDAAGRETDGYRLVHAEGDRLPGLVVDVFGDVAAVQLLTIGMKLREEVIFGEVARVTGCRTIVESPSERSQRLEGFETSARVARGPDVDALRFRERGLSFEIPIGAAQKTGFYFDQRDNRAWLERLCAGKRVLDAFSYVGAFALAAARGGAERVLAIDASAAAVGAAAVIARQNGLADRIEHTRADVKRTLPELAAAGERFDVVIVDPPKLVPTARHLESGRKAYRRLNATAARLVRDGGLLVSCSCSSAMRPGDFLRTVGTAARDAGRQALLLHLGAQGADHPVPAAFPEGRYLKCAFLRITS